MGTRRHLKNLTQHLTLLLTLDLNLYMDKCKKHYSTYRQTQCNTIKEHTNLYNLLLSTLLYSLLLRCGLLYLLLLWLNLHLNLHENKVWIRHLVF